MRAAPEPMIKVFIPKSELVQDEECDTLVLYLPDFMPEHLKGQLTTSGTLKISGERPLGNNTKEIFTKEVRIPNDCNTNAISAKFEKGILYVRQPKMIKPEKIKAEPAKEAPISQKPAMEAPSQAQEPAHANGQDEQRNWKTDKKESFDGATQKMSDEDNKKKEINEKTAKQEDAKGVTQNMEEKPPVEASGRSSARDAENVPQQTQAEAKSDGVGEITRKPEESEQRNRNSIDSVTDLHNESNLGTSRLEYYKQVVGATITELNKPRQRMNLVIAASVGLAIGLCISKCLRVFSSA